MNTRGSAGTHEAPGIADREVWGRHPVGLGVIMVLALGCAALLVLPFVYQASYQRLVVARRTAGPA